MFLKKSILKYAANLQENTHARGVIPIKLQSNFTEITALAWVFSCKFAAYFQNTFS